MELDLLDGITVIIRTTASQQRRPLLVRALESIFQERDVPVHVVIVCNADPHAEDAEFLASLEARRNVHVVRIPFADHALAIYRGRAAVFTEFFCFLDDDDEFINGALRFRAHYLRAHPSIDCVATNGVYVTPNGVSPVFPDAHRIHGRLLPALLETRNWLASSGGTFRTATVPCDLFDDLPRQREWTLLAFRLVQRVQVRFVDRVTYRIHSTEGSLSKSDEYRDAGAEVFSRMLPLATEWRTRVELERQRTSAYHKSCSYYRLRGDFGSAWRFYLRTLSSRGGWRYAPYAALLLARESRSVPELLGFRQRSTRRRRAIVGTAAAPAWDAARQPEAPERG